MHLFLEDTSKKARITQNIAPPPNCGKDNSLFPRSIDAQIWFVACQKHLAATCGGILSTRLALISYKAIHFQPRKNPRNNCDVTSFNHHNSALFQVKIDTITSQLSVLASHKHLGICRPRHLRIILATVWKLQYFE